MIKSKNLSPTRAPLSRQDIDRSLPWLRLGLGALLIGFSAVTTVAGVQRDCGPLCDGSAEGVPIWALAGLLVAGLISLGQWLTSERWPLIYAGLLLVDARYTQHIIGPPISALAAYHLDNAGLAWIVALVLSWVLALATARFGEVLLFGRRKGASDDRPGDRASSNSNGAGAGGRD